LLFRCRATIRLIRVRVGFRAPDNLCEIGQFHSLETRARQFKHCFEKGRALRAEIKTRQWP